MELRLSYGDESVILQPRGLFRHTVLGFLKDMSYGDRGVGRNVKRLESRRREHGVLSMMR